MKKTKQLNTKITALRVKTDCQRRINIHVFVSKKAKQRKLTRELNYPKIDKSPKKWAVV